METTFQTDRGRAILYDCFTMHERGEHHPHNQLLRRLRHIKGTIEFSFTIIPRFDFGAIKPWIRRIDENVYSVLGGDNELLISGNLQLRSQQHELHASIALQNHKVISLSVQWIRPEDLDEGIIKIQSHHERQARFQNTLKWWKSWAGSKKQFKEYNDAIYRSAAVLKGLINAPTGAMVAAPTTSLPESTGGSRNWDYRFSWIRDSSFAVRSLAELGYVKEAEGFRRYVERSSAGSAEQIQVLYAVSGNRRLHEYEIDSLEGYKKSKPIRIGNAAAAQLQLDVFGEIVDLAWRWHCRGHGLDNDYWNFIRDTVNYVVRIWDKPDRGIWEMH